MYTYYHFSRPVYPIHNEDVKIRKLDFDIYYYNRLNVYLLSFQSSCISNP